MNYVREYWRKIESGEIVTSRRVKAVYGRLMAEMDSPAADSPYYFDEETGERPIIFIERFCKQSQGTLGAPLRLELFQKAFIQTLFGWLLKETGYRRFRETLFLVGRKNGKSTLLAALALYMLVADYEGAAEIYSVATKKDQARKTLTEAVNMVKQSPELRAIIKKRRNDIYFPATASTFEALASDSNTLDGLNSHAVIIDELHAIRDRNLNGTVGSLSLSNFSTYAFIIGFNHNSGREGSGRIHFQLAKTALSGGTDICFTDGQYLNTGSSAAFRMNTSNTNSGGWEDSYMRNNICGTSKSTTSGRIMGAIPAELRNALKSVTKYTNNNGSSSASSAVTATTDYFFLLSEYEVFGNITYSNSYEANYQQQYAYYSAGNSKVKYRHNSTGSAAHWWLRSPCAGYSYIFVRVHTDGTVYYRNARSSLGFAPGFCV